MNAFAMIQARMMSTRLPGKALMDIGGQSMLARVIQRVSRSKYIDQTIVVTSRNPADEKIVQECRRLNIPVFRGSETDVLSRYYEAARVFKAKHIVRITSDCPLIDSDVIDRVIDAFEINRADYTSNTIKRTFPRGLDTEVFTFEALRQAHFEASMPGHREHVTLYFTDHPNRFKLFSVETEPNFEHYRWTVDVYEDLEFIRAVYLRFVNQDYFSWKKVISLLEREPALIDLNAHIRQKSN